MADPVESIAAACAARGFINGVIGMVVDKKDAWRSAGSSWCVGFEIKDSEFETPAWKNSLKIKYFNDNESKLPHVQIGDVVLLRRIRISYYQERATGIASQNQRVSWAIFRNHEDLSKGPVITTGPDTFYPTPEEKRRAIELLDKHTPQVQSNTWRTDPSQKGFHVIQAAVLNRKNAYLPMTLIKDVEINRFTQLVGQVVKDHNYEPNKSTIWITDYTANECLVDYRKDGETGTEGDPNGYLARHQDNWPGPWGQLTMQITLWDPHAKYCQEKVKPGDMVLLSYVRIKTSSNGSLEGAVHQDKKFPDKVHIRLISSDYNEEAKELMARRKAYWEIHGKPKAESKQKKKKQKNQESEKNQSKEEGQKGLSATSRTVRNPSVKIREFGVPSRSVDKVLEAETHIIPLPGGISYKAPFQNVAYSILARVIDFFPPDLADFAVQVPVKSIVDKKQHMAWDWRFCLLVESVEPVTLKDQLREPMKIFVSGAEAVHLLCLDPTDLRRDSRRLSQLREKLFLLWGNLAEQKSKGGANGVQGHPWTPPVGIVGLPIMCCVKEYGVPCIHSRDSNAMVIDGQPCIEEECYGWERRFSLYGTTIHEQ
ncbi:hypothetical protein N7520_011518 [Penicillium odoratum]|uniref:uncharacterized protein n=1 Tax=Penicillium odoratum TaxID=1167516 RepID=UPI002546EAE1|nr:uncharacterized protein N7520_011518 [Penicillium odoratum]KAJ5746336.1 hypothetical protein N7520_011518 [Penicillium odoratum]